MHRRRILDHNQKAWDRRVSENQPFTRPATDEDFANPRLRLDKRGWLGPLEGKRVLCLGAGGGKHGPLFAQAGAHPTVVDISSAQLEIDHRVAAERGLSLKTQHTSIDDLTPLYGEQFDLVVQPVSSCYIPDVAVMYREVAKVLLPGGLYVSQHKSPMNLQASLKPGPTGYEIVTPYRTKEALPQTESSRLRERGTLEFVHPMDRLLGKLCRAGFWIEDFSEPRHDKVDAEPGSFGHRAQFISPYLRIKARRIDPEILAAAQAPPGPKLIVPK